MKLPHIPLPWTIEVVGESDHGDVVQIVAENRQVVAEQLYQQDAEFIMAAVEAYTEQTAGSGANE